jgi:hypothetical protein
LRQRAQAVTVIARRSMGKPRTRFTGLLTVSAALTGCGQGEPPRELRLELPDVITSKDPVLVHVRAIHQDGTARELSGELELRVTPSELATLGKQRLLTCNRSGDGSVALQRSGVSARAKFACKLAARLEAPAKLSLDMAAGEVDAHVLVLDAAGRELDLPVSLTSDLGSVVSAHAGKLVPASVGRAKLTARVGELSKQIDVEVVRTLKPEVLPVDQNRRISYSLDAGKYRLSISLKTPHAVKVDWLGAPYCAYRGDGVEHNVDCTLQSKGSVSFDNPAFLVRGEKTPSVEGVTLREVP